MLALLTFPERSVDYSLTGCRCKIGSEAGWSLPVLNDLLESSWIQFFEPIQHLKPKDFHRFDLARFQLNRGIQVGGNLSLPKSLKEVFFLELALAVQPPVILVIPIFHYQS